MNTILRSVSSGGAVLILLAAVGSVTESYDITSTLRGSDSHDEYATTTAALADSHEKTSVATGEEKTQALIASVNELLSGGASVSLIVRVFTQRSRLRTDPALSLVPDARAPPKGCRPTTAPVGLSLI